MVLCRFGEGWVNVYPTRLVQHLTVEPSKPRLCHDERYLNLWIVDKPFSLDTLKDVPPLVSKLSFYDFIG